MEGSPWEAGRVGTARASPSRKLPDSNTDSFSRWQAEEFGIVLAGLLPLVAFVVTGAVARLATEDMFAPLDASGLDNVRRPGPRHNMSVNLH